MSTTMQPDTAPATNHLPLGWRVVRFGDVVREVKVKVDPEESGLERYVAGEHMVTDDLHIRSWGTIGDGYLGPAFHRKFVAGQVLYGSRRTYLRKVAVAEFDGVCANTTFVLEPANDDLLPELLPFIMQTEPFTRHSIGQSRGSTNPYITWKDLAWYEFPLPPRAEQQRIAELLWAADAAVEGYLLVQERVRQVLQALREEVMCDTKHPRVLLSDCLASIVAGKSVVGLNEAATASEFGVLKVSAVGADGFVEEENKSIINPQDFIPEFQVKRDDLLITRCNTRELVGRVCIVPQDYSNLMLCDKTLRLDLREDTVSREFLAEILRSREVRTQIEAAASGTGGAMKNISQKDIKNLRVPLPDLQTQQRIQERIRSVQLAQCAVDKSLSDYRQLKSSLLRELLKIPEPAEMAFV
jgi:type I restriction enzyme S subunit